MFRSMFLVTACFAVLTGCAVVPAAKESGAAVPLRDEAFGFRPGLVTVSQEDLFRLDPELLQLVQNSASAGQSPSQKLKQLLALVFGPDSKRFGYVAGHSTTAPETWAARRGDCLSLTVLTYAVARAMNMPAEMQEVDTPVLFDRRGDFDFVNQHVNVVFRGAHREFSESQPRDVVVDFEPEYASARAGKMLSERAVYARYLNNVAAEHLAAGRRDLAYAHFRAAIATDPGYASSYGNLALLYRNSALDAEAELLLKRAVALHAESDVALHALRQLLAEQGRDVEVRRYDSMLQSRRDRDPYYWIGEGLQRLEAGDPRRAIAALERARDMTGNFREVHAFLALAYWRAGEPARANDELTLLSSLGGSGLAASKLRKKFNAPLPQGELLK